MLHHVVVPASSRPRGLAALSSDLHKDLIVYIVANITVIIILHLQTLKPLVDTSDVIKAPSKSDDDAAKTATGKWNIWSAADS